MISDFCEFLICSSEWLSTLDVCPFILSCIKALNFMVIKSWATTSLCLYKTNHSFCTLRVKASIIRWMNISLHELLISYRICCKSWLGVISKVRDESLAIIKVYLHSLIIYWCPFTFYCSHWGTFIIRTKVYGGLIIIFKGDLCCFRLRKGEFIRWCDYLYTIRHIMRANVSRFKEVNCLCIFTKCKSPITVHFLPKTMNWLISFYYLVSQKINE